MKQLVLACTATTVLLFGCSNSATVQPIPEEKVTAQAHGDIPYFMDIGHLTEAADTIFLGKVERMAGTRNLARDPQAPSKEDPNIYIEGVDFEVKVTDYLKGQDEKIVWVTSTKQRRMSQDAPLILNEYYTELEDGETYLFFVKKSSSSHYYGIGEPFVFTVKDNLVTAKSMDKKLVEHFKQKKWEDFKKDIVKSK